MKNLKRIVCLMLIGLLSVVLLAGCSSDENVLKVATNAEFPPFEEIQDGEYVGFDMDLIRLIGEEMGYEVQIDNMEFESVVGSLPAGTHNVAISGLTITPTRSESVDFSDSYNETAQILIVRNDDTNFTGTDKATLDEQLKNKRIGVCIGFTGEKYANGDDELGYTAIEGAQVTSFDNVSLAVTELKNGNLDAIIMDDTVAKNVAESDANKDSVKVIDVPLTTEYYAIAVKKGNTELKDKINSALKEIKDSGKLDELIEQWGIKDVNQ